MTTSGVSAAPTARAESVSFTADTLVVRLKDGRIVSARLDAFPCLRDATAGQRARWELTGRGIGIHWTDLDEDISVAGLLGLSD
jgi:hypothetical protein